jgi:phospholipid/cholesterol/gamma-HCH transport system substrate-binding protein
MKKWSAEFAVGLFALIGILCIGYLTVRLGKLEILSSNTYPVSALFQSISGLKVGSAVEMAGVPIGEVQQIALDQQRQMARVDMKIHNGVVLTDDAIASIKTSGLIGDKYVKITPGGSEQILPAGGLITETESALDIEELISKYVFGKI